MDRTRREFLADVGRGMLVASVGAATAADLDLVPAAFADDKKTGRLSFGSLEPLAGLMQDTPADKQLPLLVKKLQDGTSLPRAGRCRRPGQCPAVRRARLRRLAHVHGPGAGLRDGQGTARTKPGLAGPQGAVSQRPDHAGPGRPRGTRPSSPSSRAPCRKAGPAASCCARRFGTRTLAAADATFAALARRKPEDAYNDLQPIVEEAIFPDADGIHCVGPRLAGLGDARPDRQGTCPDLVAAVGALLHGPGAADRQRIGAEHPQRAAALAGSA